MAIPTDTYGGLSDYAKKSNAQLVIQSVLGGTSVTLPAFVTDFSLDFDSTWNQEEVYGRVDPIATFQGTKRTISMSLSLPAGNLKTAGENYNNCRSIMQFLYPGYYSKTTPIVDQKALRRATKNQSLINKGNDEKKKAQAAQLVDRIKRGKQKVAVIKLGKLRKDEVTLRKRPRWEIEEKIQ